MSTFARLPESRRDVLQPAPLHELFWRRAESTPRAVALVCEGAALTYGELAARAGALARRLRRAGVGPETVVALALERSVDMVVAILGALRAGGAYLPLDPRDPPRRLAHLLRDAGVGICLARHELRDRLPPALDVLAPRDWEPGGAGERDAPAAVSPDCLAYVMYTSGSTGRPKGVLVTHRAVHNRLAWFCDEYRIGPGEVFLQKTPYTFDVSVPEIFCPLVTGGRLVLARPEGHRDAAYLRDLVRDEGVTTVHFVPSMLGAFLEEPGLQACASLRRVLSSGEALTPALQDRFFRALGGTGCELVNLYGPTETAIEVSAWTCRGGARTVPIGRALPNVRLRVLDGDLRPVARGQPGELCVGGVQVARGYHGRPDLTAAAFVPDPDGGGERLYRTGDLVRGRADGALEFHGRLDDQVKVRGFRVELGEVEANLLQHACVREAAVVARPGPDGDARLVAYVVSRPEDRPPGADLAADLAAFLARRLPAHMVPAGFVAIDRLPLTPSGKLDRRALPEVEPAAGPGGEAPRTPEEEAVAAIWEEVLGVPVGRDQDFGELGGHSLHAVRVLARIARRARVHLDVKDLVEARTVAALAERLAAAPAAPGEAGPAPAPAGEPPAVSMSQRRLWFIDQVAPGTTAYNMAIAVRLRGRLAIDSLAWALAEVIRRHDVLRSSFAPRDGEPALELRQPWAPALLPEDVAEADLPAELERDAARPFDVAAGPLFRARLLRLAPDDHVLALGVHHGVCDGWSWGVLFRDLSALYRAHREGAPPALRSLPLQFADYAAWQRRRLSGPALDRLVELWRERLAGAPPALELPVDRPRGPAAASRGERRRALATPDLARAVERLARRLGVTVFVALLAAFELLLGRLSGAEDLVVGTPVAGRDHPELEDLVGFFVNMLPLRADLAGEPTFAELAGRAQEAMLHALRHPELPIERLVDELRVERDLARSPVFQVVFNMYSFDTPRLQLPGVSAETLDEATPGSPFDLTLYVRGHESGLRFDAVYDPDLFDAARMDELLAQYVHLLEQVVETPDRPIGTFSLVTGRARAVLPDPRAVLPARRSASLLDRLRDHAAAAPDRPAIAGPAASLTYGQLDRASEEAAHLLRRMGVRRGDVVAVHADRSVWLPVAMLAAMRARAAFVVLDAGHPPARLAEHVRRARPAAWIDVSGAPPGPELEACLSGLPRLRLPAPPAPFERGEGPAADDPAYVAFTSGSTGGPRAVLGTHAPVWHFLDWYASTFDLGAGDRFAMLAGLSHDPVLRDVLAPVWTGAALHVPRPADWPASESLLRWLRGSRVTVAHLTPVLARLLRAAGPLEEGLPDLRLACLGGDVLTRRCAAELAELAPNARLVNFYGTTETPQAVAWLALPDPAAPGPAAIPVGRGIEGVQLLVLAGDPRAPRQAGIGELGEVCVRTPYLAAGYLDGPAGGFGANPFAADDGDRLYRTGDLGRHRPGGDVELAGRRDRQVKVRGFRVEPSEVEHALRELPQVADAVVLPADRDGEPALVAYVVARGRPAPAAELRARLRRRLPDYLVPGELVAVARLPVTPNGKLDEAALAGAAVAAPADGTLERAASRARARLRPPTRRPGSGESSTGGVT